MKADFSRLRLDPAKHDAAWLEQQGRVRLDSDANEAELARLLLLRLQALDVVGGCGAPQPGGGFSIGPGSGPDDFPDIDLLGRAHHRQFVHQRDVDHPERVLQ